MWRLTISTLCLVLLASPGIAQQSKAIDDESASRKAGSPTSVPSKSKPLRSVVSQDSFSIWEFWTDVTIPAGASVNLDSRTDYSTVDTVRATIRSAGPDLNNVVVAAYWAIPQAPFYGIADVVAGTTFPFLNAGGATFNTYGSQFRLRVTNNGSNPISLTQVLIFARVH